jgi:hypothetical protein
MIKKAITLPDYCNKKVWKNIGYDETRARNSPHCRPGNAKQPDQLAFGG